MYSDDTPNQGGASREVHVHLCRGELRHAPRAQRAQIDTRHGPDKDRSEHKPVVCRVELDALGTEEGEGNVGDERHRHIRAEGRGEHEGERRETGGHFRDDDVFLAVRLERLYGTSRP